MKTIFGLIAATGMLATSAAPLFAETVIGDPMTTSCSDYLSQSDTDRLSLAMQYQAYHDMSEADKAAVEAMTDEQKAAMIADARTKREAMSTADMDALTKAADNWKVQMDTKCQADGGKMVVDVMETGM